MQSVTSEVVNIRLPKKNICIISNKSKYNEKYNYELQPIRDCFDPNISTSPPNDFIELLKKRMEFFYTESV
jgi:hypothetical protein